MNEDIVTLVDEETSEELELRVIDRFEKDDRTFGVFLTITDDDDDAQILILELVEDNDDIVLKSLDEAEEDSIYDFYDSLCDEETEDQ